jgi:hypothetical protein
MFASRLLPSIPLRKYSAISRLLESSAIFVSADAYLRFLVAAVLYAALPEVLVVAFVPNLWSLPLLSPFVALQVTPILLPFYRRWRRTHGVEAELPFVTMLLFVLSHESFPNINDAFRKIRELGPEIFPFFFRESAILDRNLSYTTQSDLTVMESTFSTNPNAEFRSLVHGYLSTLLAGRNLHGFAREESGRLLDQLEERWRTFSRSLSSLAELSFVFLAILPLGMQMIATALFNLGSANLVTASVLLLTLMTVVTLGVMDAIQPALHDRKYSMTGLFAVISVWFVFSVLHHFGVVNIEEALIPPTVSSAAAVYLSRPYFSYLHSSEREVGAFLHDLAEESRAGASLPVATSRVLRRAHRYPSISASLAHFDGLLRLGYTPTEAQKRVTHPSWLVRLCFALLSVSFETGAAFDQLERLSSSFRRIYDAKRALATSMIPLVLLGVSVPVISAAAVWFLSSMAIVGGTVPGFGAPSRPTEVALSISAASILSGMIVSKAYTLSIRSLTALPVILFATLASLIFFGLR